MCFTVYGMFIIVSAIRYSLFPPDYAIWFLVAVGAWGASLIFIGLYPLSPTRGRTWGLFFGTLGVLLGAFESYWGIYAYSYLCSLGPRCHIPGPIVMFSWGATLLLGGLYLLLRKRASVARC